MKKAEIYLKRTKMKTLTNQVKIQMSLQKKANKSLNKRKKKTKIIRIRASW